MKAKIAVVAALVLVLTAGCTSAHAEVFGKNADRGAIAGGIAGAIIGNNTGDRNSVRGAAIGAGAGLVLGAIMDQNQYRNSAPREVVYETREVVYDDCRRSGPVVYRYDHRAGGVVVVERRYWVNGRLRIEQDHYWRSHSGRYYRRH